MCNGRPCRLAILLGMFLLVAAPPALAHKLKLFAWVEGGRIVGSVYFPGGGVARGVTVSVLDSNGRKLGETKTDEKGEFAFVPTVRCDHVFVASSGDGHRAEFTLTAAELPPEAGLQPVANGDSPAEPATLNAEKEPGPAVSPPSRAPLTPAEIEQAVSSAVQCEMNRLRQQLDRQAEERRLRDILGGIGYIFGLGGIALYFLARCKRGG